MTHTPEEDRRDAPQEPCVARRVFLLAGIGTILAGCTQQRTADLPSPAWPQDTTPTPVPGPVVTQPAPSSTVIQPGYIVPRKKWATGKPVPSMMNRMSPVRYITVHHDGMRPFLSTDERSTAARLESIRRGHRNQQWGDIGYHFAVDRKGRVWECRPLNYQGAHVKNHNPGNIGVLVIGNFDEQTPSKSQLQGVQRHVTWLMRTYRVPTSRVRTHQEWETARTRCPGTNMQRYVLVSRGNWLV